MSMAWCAEFAGYHFQQKSVLHRIELTRFEEANDSFLNLQILLLQFRLILLVQLLKTADIPNQRPCQQVSRSRDSPFN